MGVLAGILQRSGSPDPSVLRAMADALAHRAASRPEVQIDGQLGWVGVPACGDSQAIAIDASAHTAAALAAAFPDRLEEVEGLFALVARDAEGERLHLLRDRFGGRPLYYAFEAERLLFASEIHGLLAAGYPVELELEIFRQHLARGWAEGTQTPLAGIHRVPAAGWMEIDTVTLEVESKEWYGVGDWVDEASAAELQQGSREQNAGRVEAALEAAVARRLPESGRVATLCSGGIDSSLMTVLAARAGADVTAFTVALPDQPEWDESAYAREVCEVAGIELVEVVIDSPTWQRELVRATCGYEYPYRVESGVSMAIIGRKVADAGFGSLWAGDGADTLFGGLDYKNLELRERVGRSLPSGVPELTFHEQSWPIDPSLDKLFEVEGELPASQLYLDEFGAAAADACAFRGGDHAALAAANLVALRADSARTFLQFDKALSSSGVALEEPFLDLRVARLGLNLPLDHVMAPKAKGVLREVAARYLPGSVLERSKLGFSLEPAATTLGRVNPEFLLSSKLRERFGIEKDWKLLKFIEDGAGRGRGICRLLCGEIWLQHFIEGQSVAQIEAALWL